MPAPLSFTAFVLSLASTAAIHFGDLADPESGQRAERNLEGAAQMIEIRAPLEEKTRGNLTNDERQVLGQVLCELRMRAWSRPRVAANASLSRSHREQRTETRGLAVLRTRERSSYPNR